MEENLDAKSVNTINRSGNGFQDVYKENYEENELDIAGVKIDRKYKLRTPALPQHNLVFQ
jgi:hypothetical protein